MGNNSFMLVHIDEKYMLHGNNLEYKNEIHYIHMVFISSAGSEAMLADLGHFSVRAIFLKVQNPFYLNREPLSTCLDLW